MRNETATLRDAGRRAAFTIVSTNYIAYAATLMQSLREQHPEISRFIVLVDTPQEFPGLDLGAELLPCIKCGIVGLENMALWYDVMELNTAVKPSVFLHLFARGFEQVVYLDPDIMVTAPLDAVWAGLTDHSCVLTPHHLRPLQDGGHPDDLAIMKSGIYNLGFLGLKADQDGQQLAAWWADRLLMHCRVDIASNMFTDQRWMDLAPAFVERSLILRHPGYNLAYWNLPHRTVVGSQADGWTVDGLPLVFVHLSGIKPDDPRQFSKHQDRFTAETLPEAMAEICVIYRTRVLANGWEQFAKVAYGYAHFQDGRRIEPPMRRWLLRMLDQGRFASSEPLKIPSDFFDAAEDNVPLGKPLTRLMYQVWLDRPDLREHFTIASAEGAAAYQKWFLTGGAKAAGVEQHSIVAAHRLSVAFPTPPPWTSVITDVWSGPSNKVSEFLADVIEAKLDDTLVTLPRVFALAWERRSDLHRHFPLGNIAQLNVYIAWCLTHGVQEGSTTVDGLPHTLLERLTQPVILAGQDDMPMTEALMLTRNCPIGREGQADWQSFPHDRKARLAHGLWFAYVAPSLLHWPDTLVAPLRNWFAERTDMTVAGFAFSRAALVLWWLRKDIAELYPLFDERSRSGFLSWLLTSGLKELGVPLHTFDPLLADKLMHNVPDTLDVSWFAWFLISFCRRDLADAFDLTTSTGKEGFKAWCHNSLMAEYGGTPAGKALRSTSESLGPVKAVAALTGNWASPTGIGEHMRSTAQALLICGFEKFVLVDIVSGRMQWADGTPILEGVSLEVDCNIVHLNADCASENWIRLRNLGVKSKRTVGCWAWELESLPACWLHSYSYYDELWAMSSFTAEALRKPGLRPVLEVPHPVTLPNEFKPTPRAEFGFQEETVFLFMFDPNSFVARKNPQGVIQAFLHAFPGEDEPVRLVIKTHNAANFHEIFVSLRALAVDRRIEFRDECMDREAVLSLVAAADAFVSLHRSEGFGRGPAEAMLLGKPVILTDYSGTRDFADAGNALLVPYTLVPVAFDEYIGVEGQCWAEPDLDVAATHMRWVHQNPESAYRLGQHAQARIHAKYALANAGPQILKALNIDVPAKQVEVTTSVAQSDTVRVIAAQTRAADLDQMTSDDSPSQEISVRQVKPKKPRLTGGNGHLKQPKSESRRRKELLSTE